MLQVDQESRPYSGCSERSVDVALLVRAFFDEPKDFMHLNEVAFHPGNLSDADHPALAIGQALQLNQQADRRRDLDSNARGADGHAGHTYYLLQPLDRITR